MQHDLQANLDCLLFLHGLLLVMFGVCARILVRLEQQRIWRWLSAFAYAAAASVWLSMLAVDWGEHPGFAPGRLVLLALSVLLLWESARDHAGNGRRLTPGRWIHVPIAGAAAAMVWFKGADPALPVIAALGLGGGLWTATRLWSLSRRQSTPEAARQMRIMTVTFCGYLAGMWVNIILGASAAPDSDSPEAGYAITELLLCGLAALAFAGLLWHYHRQHLQPLTAEQRTQWFRRELGFAVLLTAVVAAGWLVAEMTGHQADTTLRQQVLMRTQLAASSVESDLVQQLHWDATDLTNPAYLHLKRLMRSFARANADLRFAELMGLRDGKTYFLVDSEPPNSPDYSPPGQFYEEAEPGYLKAIALHQAFVLGPIADRWGIWITGSVPVATLGPGKGWVTFDLDLAANGWDARVRLARLPIVLIALLISVLGITFYRAQERVRETLRQVASAKEAAEGATRAKSEFLAVMSHEIRTPVSGVIGLLDLLRKQPLPPRQLHFASLAQDNAEHLLGILDEILDTAKIESGKLSIEAIPFRLRTELNHGLAAVRVRAEAKGLEFDWNVDAAVPAVLIGDPTRLRQMVANLVSNALKFTERGGIYVDVRREPADDASRATIRVSVRDTGIGIPAALQERLFTKFEQADVSTSRQYGGTGLGLAIVKNLAERMNGSIALESIPGVGSIFAFTLRLPVGSDRDVPLPESVAARPPPAARHAVKLRLLGAEDDPSNREILRYLVTQMGHEIEFSENGRQAVDHLCYDRFDAILMDNRMPVMDGFEATRLIRNPESGVLDPGVHIIAITANATQAYRDECLAAGMSDYLTKPLREAALHAALDRVIAYQRGRGIELPAMPAVEAGTRPAIVPAAPPAGLTAEELIAAVEAPAAPPDPATQFPAETLRKITIQYLERTPQILAEMRRALDASDLETLGRGAHSLKSNSWYVRGQEMSAICAELEARADAGNDDGLGSLVERAEQAFARLRPSLENSVGAGV